MIPALYRSRSYWLRQIRLWHRISAAVSLAGIMLFSVTGLMLNNPALFRSQTETTETSVTLPADLQPSLKALTEGGQSPLPPALSAWIAATLSLPSPPQSAEVSADELYLPFAGPGRDGWLALERDSGEGLLSHSSGGWIAWLNDLHKGRNTGQVWGWFIDLLAIACILFTLTGLGLLWLQSRQQKANAPLGWASLVLPLLIAVLVLH